MQDYIKWVKWIFFIWLGLAALGHFSPAQAAMYCTDGVNIANWTVGQGREVFDDIDIGPGLSCAASGQELNYIQQHFSGLKMRNLPSLPDSNFPTRGRSWVYWSGDDAIFIASNM